jgi:hypothetical protein
VVIAELEEAIAALAPPSEQDFLRLPVTAEQWAYRRGARDAYRRVIEVLRATEASDPEP